MTIEEILNGAALLEDEAENYLSAANENFRMQEKRTPGWLKASDELFCWTDVRNGLRMATESLHAIVLMEKGGDQK